MKGKKGFIPAILGVELHYFFVGFAVGMVLLIILMVLGRTGTLPFSICKLVCG